MIVSVFTLSKVTTSKPSNGSDSQILTVIVLHSWCFNQHFFLFVEIWIVLAASRSLNWLPKNIIHIFFRCQFFFLLRFVWTNPVLSALQPRHFDFGCGLSPQSLAKCIMVLFHPKIQRNRLGLSFKIDSEDVIFFAYLRKSRRKYGFCIGKCTYCS